LVSLPGTDEFNKNDFGSDKKQRNSENCFTGIPIILPKFAIRASGLFLINLKNGEATPGKTE
jgi:hypothetical protein